MRLNTDPNTPISNRSPGKILNKGFIHLLERQHSKREKEMYHMRKNTVESQKEIKEEHIKL